MDILTFSRFLRRHGLQVFRYEDALALLPGKAHALLALQLHQWAAKGWLRRLRRGVYESAYPEPLEIPDLHVANRLYEPSYVSLEAALSHYQLIPETSAGVTCVTPKPTRRFENFRGVFTYFTVRPKAFTGWRVLRLQGHPVRIAEPEKAVVDRLYAGLRRGERPEQDGLRWDRRALAGFERSRVADYARRFGREAAIMRRFDAVTRRAG